MPQKLVYPPGYTPPQSERETSDLLATVVKQSIRYPLYRGSTIEDIAKESHGAAGLEQQLLVLEQDGLVESERICDRQFYHITRQAKTKISWWVHANAWVSAPPILDWFVFNCALLAALSVAGIWDSFVPRYDPTRLQLLIVIAGPMFLVWLGIHLAAVFLLFAVRRTRWAAELYLDAARNPRAWLDALMVAIEALPFCFLLAYLLILEHRSDWTSDADRRVVDYAASLATIILAALIRWALLARRLNSLLERHLEALFVAIPLLICAAALLVLGEKLLRWKAIDMHSLTVTTGTAAILSLYWTGYVSAIAWLFERIGIPMPKWLKDKIEAKSQVPV